MHHKYDKPFLKALVFVQNQGLDDLHYYKGHLFFEDGNIDDGTCDFYIKLYTEETPDDKWKEFFQY